MGSSLASTSDPASCLYAPREAAGVCLMVSGSCQVGNLEEVSDSWLPPDLPVASILGSKPKGGKNLSYSHSTVQINQYNFFKINFLMTSGQYYLAVSAWDN